MKTKYQFRNLSRSLLGMWLTVALGQQGISFGQSTIVPVTVPGALSLTVHDLGESGYVVGSYTNGTFEQRAFLFYSNGALDLGTFGGTLAAANAVNSLGEVAGDATHLGNTVTRPFLYRNGALINLGSFGGIRGSAVSLNNAGQVTGHSSVNDAIPIVHAFLRNGNGLFDLGTLGGNMSMGMKINENGQVAGESTLSGEAATHVFLNNGGTMFDLGTLGGTSSRFVDLNDAGWVAGDSYLPGDREVHAFLFDSEKLRDLGTLGGSSSRAAAMNQHGAVVGDSLLTGDLALRGFVYSGLIMQDVGHLGGNSSSARAINNLGQVVGVSLNPAGVERAFVWENGRLTDLNHRLLSASGWELTRAHFINDASQVVGEGLFNGQPTWFLMTLAAAQNQLPIANAGFDQIVECVGPLTEVRLDGSGSTDPEEDTLSYEWQENGGVLGRTPILRVGLTPGFHTITLVVFDPGGGSAQDTVAINIVDTTPPVFSCRAGVIAAPGENCEARVPDLISSLAATDNCTAAAALMKRQDPPPGTLVSANTHVILTVTDAAGNEARCLTVLVVADNVPPVLACPGNLVLSSGDHCESVLPDLLTHLNAFDNCTPREGLVKRQTPVAGTLLGPGAHQVTITVTDASGNSTHCVVEVRVVDTVAPVLKCRKQLTLPLKQGAHVALPDLLADLVVSDNCTPASALTKTQRPLPGTLLSAGKHLVTIIVSDASGNSARCTVGVLVADTTPPVIRSLSVAPNSLAPNGKLVPVQLRVNAHDNCDTRPRCHIVSVHMNAEERNHPCNNARPDWVITGSLGLKLRAETCSNGPRVYTIKVECKDASGNGTTETVKVTVQKEKETNKKRK